MTAVAPSKTREYAIYRGIITRCENPAAHDYASYGGRGIRMCKLWRQSFAAFLADMGPRPSPKHSVDRIDTLGNYEPSNCRWATPIEQGTNRRDNRIVTYRGREMTVTDAVRLAGSVIHYEAAAQRIARGWAVPRAVETPPLCGKNSQHRRAA